MKLKTEITAPASREEIETYIRGDVAIHIILRPPAEYSEFFEKHAVKPNGVLSIPGQPDRPAPLSTEDEETNSRRFLHWLNVVTMVEYAICRGKEVLEQGPLEWENVDLDDIETYEHAEAEVTEAFKLTNFEWRKLEIRVRQVNQLDSSQIDQAREDFLLQRAEKAGTP